MPRTRLIWSNVVLTPEVTANEVETLFSLAWVERKRQCSWPVLPSIHHLDKRTKLESKAHARLCHVLLAAFPVLTACIGRRYPHARELFMQVLELDPTHPKARICSWPMRDT